MAATSSRSASLTLPADDQILITREFDAPRHLVYRAWTEPELIRRWWHAKRGEVTAVEVDLRPGGRWRYAMVADGGFEVGFHGEYREVVPNEKIVSTEAYEGIPDPDENATSRDVRDAIIASGMEDGLQDALDLLEEIAVSLR
jgi:uncharacterized protein YndB with AHSA1/START domain